ncbi:pathway-specific regulatory protein [Penicillium canariense]|uniref:Pathway-specific regulatory protein n=1 Tax=Penicillium canariense TaxID=189055 RepID=A0A9W9IGU7_9EURO|nr:pathway-specific regulatory protein [Penicillium canariense]KAJ5176127.1 pathway-specific regulatory protein [Penicillium canariense]
MLNQVGETTEVSEPTNPANEDISHDSVAPGEGRGGREPSQANRHRAEVKRAIAAIPSEYRELIFDMYEAASQADRSREQTLFESVQDRKSAQQVRAFVDGMLANAGLSALNHQIVGHPSEILTEIEAEIGLPRARPRVMDIRYLCSIVPVRVPAKPWTTVTDDDDLVSHLISLYLTWGYPFYAFFCRETFVKHMKLGHPNSDFCSPLLVNALLANACFYSDYSEAYSLPGDVKRKGAHFLAEAEWHLRSHQIEGRSDTRLASLQATLLLYERYSMSGNDNFGYTMLHRAIEMAESLGIVNNAKEINLEASHFSKDMRRSIKRTAWGLFQIDTIVHMNFLRQSLIKSVNVDRISRNETPADEQWTPYPNDSVARPSHMSVYFDEACKLSFIARDASWTISRTDRDGNRKEELYGRLREWEKALPQIFELSQKPAPYVLILRMRYHTMVINLCCHDLQNDMTLTRTKEHTSGLTSSAREFGAMKAALLSARAIASLIRYFETEYGLEHSHQFAMYAINVSLFCLLAQEDFDILDRDFLSLTKAFSMIACRSQVGRHLFRAFKISIRSRSHIGTKQSPGKVPPAIKELFGPREDFNELDKWDYYAESLAEVDGEGSFLKNIVMDPTVPGLHDMLKWYESLSIGKEVQWRRSQQPAF